MIISKHAEERYAERIMSYEEKVDRSVFIAQHKDKIEKDLNKMKDFGQLLYSGKSLKDDKTIVDIYLNGTWVLLVDKNKDLLITVYKVDLKVDEDFTKEYISKSEIVFLSDNTIIISSYFSGKCPAKTSYDFSIVSLSSII